MKFKWIGKSSDGKSVVLNRLEEKHFRFPEYFNSKWESENAGLVRVGCVLDVETTGLHSSSDQVIEIGIRQFKFNRESGEVLSLGKSYTAFHDPGVPLSVEVTRITGITDEMVKGQKIDWKAVDDCLNESTIVIAHNAGFDRPFIDPHSSVSRTKIWGCSLKQIDWTEKGYQSQKLEVLAIYHGFFNDSHRALNDTDSLLHLLCFRTEAGAPYLQELLHRARKLMVQIIASQSPFESKDHLKNRHYRWDGQNKYWAKEIEKEQLTEELKWLEEVVYGGKFRGSHREIQLVDHFKG